MNRMWHPSLGKNALAFLAVLAFTSSAARAQYNLVQISVDNFTNTDSSHKTEVEPDTFSWGSTIVSTFHVARRPGSIGWGSADVGFATSTDGGSTWHYGYLPGLTVNYQGGTFGAAADPSVAYDAKHRVWMISTLPLVGLNGFSGKIGDVAVSRSPDGLHWGKPILIDNTALDDKNWTVCDNTATSPYYGNCYTEWDQAYGSGDVLMSVSSDGGLTWGPGKASSDHAGGLGGEPLVQPNGTVVVPFEGGGIDAFSSTDGGNSWGRSVVVASIQSHYEGNIRNPNLPTAGIDGVGNLFVAWSDCRFRTGCSSNDVVFSTSADGQSWTAPARIPIDAVGSTVDHFLPGIGVDPATSGAGAHLTVVYYYYPVSKCTSSCQLDVGFTSSEDGGATWSAGVHLAGPMQLSWLPVSDNGPMVADYIGVSYNNGNPFGVFAVAQAPVGGVLREAMYTTRQPLLASPGATRFSSRADQPVPGAKSDHKMVYYYDDEGHVPIPPSKLVTPQDKK
ncbi:MAG TPA: sialidase family protein [Terriglobia bacterium]|nr:sialidase family protein [Terriglobia bacterium]